MKEAADIDIWVGALAQSPTMSNRDLRQQVIAELPPDIKNSLWLCTGTDLNLLEDNMQLETDHLATELSMVNILRPLDSDIDVNKREDAAGMPRLRLVPPGMAALHQQEIRALPALFAIDISGGVCYYLLYDESSDWEERRCCQPNDQFGVACCCLI